MADASDERTLATWLAGRSDEALAALFSARGVSPSATWRDLFDAAEGLLDAASVDRALIRLPRAELASLTAATRADAADGPELAALRDAGLVRGDGAPYRAVAARAAALRAEHPDAFAPAPSDLRDPQAADPVGEAVAAERAFSSSAALADILLATLHTPLSLTAAGSVSAADRKRLVEIGAVTGGEQLDDLLAAAAGARLVRPALREQLVTRRGSRWLSASTAERWATIARGFVASAPSALRTAEGGLIPVAAWSGAYPLDVDWPARSARLRRVAEAWGLLTPDGRETPWGSALRARGEADVSALTAHLPPEIDRVYLQADLSAISPGPLLPALDLRLRGIAVRESRAQASTYRFTADSLAAGLTEGETAGSIREFLSGLSITGIPQPLAYLIESTAARHGRIRVRALPGRSRVESEDAGLLAAIEVDQALRHLGLVDDGDALASKASREAVYWSLADARYPVVALDETGAPEPLHRHRIAEKSTALDPLAAFAPLLARLRAARGDDGDAAWRERELDQAVRSRTVVAIVVRLPDGSTREFVLEATGLGGGRLRGRDRGADIERTLPVSSIESVRPV